MRITVMGGGVAGSASAIALARIGAEATLYEAYEDPAGPVGSYVSLAVNGLRALNALGCLEPVQRAGFPVARQLMWSGRGKLLGDVARGRRTGDPLHSVTVMRADLVTALREEALRAGARIVTGQRLAGTAGPRAGDADLVVGADGIWSAARRDLDPAAPGPRYAGIYHVSGSSDAGSRLRVSDGISRHGFNWIFARHGVFIYLPAPDGTVWWSAQVAAAQPPADPAAVSLDDLRETFRTEPQAAAVLGTATGVRSATLGWVLPPVTCRHNDRIVLVGDAAHPVGAGQGASMALEDAVVLARELAAAPGIAAGLAAFDRERQPRSGKLAKTEAANRDAKIAGPVATRMRELIMPHVFSRFYEKATSWLYEYDPGTLPSGDELTAGLVPDVLPSTQVFLHAERAPRWPGAQPLGSGGVTDAQSSDRAGKARRMEEVIRGYFDACNTGDADAVATYFAPGAVHYFPPDMYDGPFRGGHTIGAKWSWAVQTLGSHWTVDEIICDPDTDRAVIEWTHQKTKTGVVLRGDEWYHFDPDSGLISEIRAYYASPQAAGLDRLELGGYPYAERGYAASS